MGRNRDSNASWMSSIAMKLESVSIGPTVIFPVRNSSRAICQSSCRAPPGGLDGYFPGHPVYGQQRRLLPGDGDEHDLSVAPDDVHRLVEGVFRAGAVEDEVRADASGEILELRDDVLARGVQYQVGADVQRGLGPDRRRLGDVDLSRATPP